MALSTDLDGPCGMQTQALDEQLIETLDSNTLWFEYRIDDDITVSCIFSEYLLMH